MTTPETHPQAIDDYIEAVRAALSDLPADEVADLTADVAEHLDQVRSEFDEGEVSTGALRARLGSPADYAAELRRSAGLPGPPGAAAGAGVPKVAFTRRMLRFLSATLVAGAAGFLALALLQAFVLGSRPALIEDLMVMAVIAGVGAAGGFTLLLVSSDDRRAELAAVPGAGVVGRGMGWFRGKAWSDDVVAFVVSLRPAWWVLRAALVAWVAIVILGGGAVSVVPLFLLVLAASIWLGRLAANGRVTGRPLYASYALNAGLGVAAVVAALSLTANAGVVQSFDGVEYAGSYPDEPVYAAYDEYGEPVTNLYAYDAEGNLIDQVRLYDQAGRPFELPSTGNCDDFAAYGESFTVESPWGPNVFPRGAARVDAETGECTVADAKPPFGAALPGGPGDDVSDSPDAPPGATPAPEVPPSTTPVPTPVPTSTEGPVPPPLTEAPVPPPLTEGPVPPPLTEAPVPPSVE